MASPFSAICHHAFPTLDIVYVNWCEPVNGAGCVVKKERKARKQEKVDMSAKGFFYHIAIRKLCLQRCGGKKQKDDENCRRHEGVGGGGGELG